MILGSHPNAGPVITNIFPPLTSIEFYRCVRGGKEDIRDADYIELSFPESDGGRKTVSLTRYEWEMIHNLVETTDNLPTKPLEMRD